MYFRVLTVHLLLLASPLLAQQRVVTQGNGKLVVLEADGKASWEMQWEGIHDVHTLPNGHFLVQQGAARVAEIDPVAKKVVWSYDSATSNGNDGKPVEVHAFQPLEDGKLMIAESGPGRIIEIDRDGKLLHEVKLQVDHPHPHTDTRLVRKLSSGNYLVCHEGDGVVREYDATGKVAWEFDVPLFDQEPRPGHGPEAFGDKCFAAVRLPNGNSLVATGNGHSVLEVTPAKEIVWKLTQNDLKDITLAWVTTLEVLPNGHYLIGNCHAGPGQPVLIEMDPSDKRVVWTLDAYDTLGNNVSNSQALGLDTPSLR
jgi:outer membrane protein assembly factor BamB